MLPSCSERGRLLGVSHVSLQPASADLTAIILPPMKSGDIQECICDLLSSPKKRIVRHALRLISSFGNHMALGFPVEPDVVHFIDSEVLCHSDMKSL